MINIVCALQCEAKPLIDYYRLSSAQETIFPIYYNENIRIIISGIGRVATASAVTYLYGWNDEQKNQAWLNLGIVGDKSSAIGSLLNINKVIEQATGLQWYPWRLPENNNKNMALLTVDVPCKEYTESCAIDMEASAFMAITLRFTTLELVQLLKVVSDREEGDLQKIDKKFVSELIGNKLTGITAVIDAMQKAADQYQLIYSSSDNYQRCLKQWHFTQYQRKELERLIQRWEILNELCIFEALIGCKTAKQVLDYLRNQVNQSEVAF